MRKPQLQQKMDLEIDVNLLQDILRPVPDIRLLLGGVGLCTLAWPTRKCTPQWEMGLVAWHVYSCVPLGM